MVAMSVDEGGESMVCLPCLHACMRLKDNEMAFFMCSHVEFI